MNQGRKGVQSACRNNGKQGCPDNYQNRLKRIGHHDRRQAPGNGETGGNGGQQPDTGHQLPAQKLRQQSTAGKQGAADPQNDSAQQGIERHESITAAAKTLIHKFRHRGYFRIQVKRHKYHAQQKQEDPRHPFKIGRHHAGGIAGSAGGD